MEACWHKCIETLELQYATARIITGDFVTHRESCHWRSMAALQRCRRALTRENGASNTEKGRAEQAAKV